MKKALLFILIAILIFTFSGCRKTETTSLTVGFLCSSEQVYDKDVNQAVWDALTGASVKYEITAEYAVCTLYDKESVASGIDELYQKGCRMIYTADYKFATALSSLQKSYKDCKFICLDYSLSSISSNSMCIQFAEHEAAFVAAVAAANELKTGKIACILGMDLPSSQKYLSGLKSGIEYANRIYGTSVTLDESGIVFIGSYNDPSLAYNLADEMYNNGVKGIFTDGYRSGDGVYAAAINARKIGLQAYVIGNRTDNYDKGIYENSDDSVSLVSAAFNYTTAVNYPIDKYLSGGYQGGKLIVLSCSSDGIAAPQTSKNLSAKSVEASMDTVLKIKNGEIIVKDPSSLLD